MACLRFRLAGGCLLAAALLLPGCRLFPHWMQPSQLWKLNRQPAWDESAFSVPDPGPAMTLFDPANSAPPHESEARN